ncbi:50S ribosome-binding GTPase [Serratia nevei]|uniref:GTPase family protein n=1 Tax=Serratia TaxID=613 RepID=UPI001A2C4A1F|nr:GTPase [Serratia marcescens]MDF8318214.1 50S ribosome-binding GTPase [Serratia nevei]MDF8324478.1 50S ribosome-binding GTPase [Serratia nevei]MDF8338063.1 50S ribosome-binding GTPase [Serratia nevei]MDF8344336.1 50S ribosome-binding GTPase [Serratia nevei]MDF8349087.1 50S ribosome-binding GTPase [Serratia nevei]
MLGNEISTRNQQGIRGHEDNLINGILDIFPEKIRENLFMKIKESIDYEPAIGVMGKTGAGKSSLCNSIFKGQVCAVSDVEACTRDVQVLRISFGQRSLKLIDIPGVGESADRDKEYEVLYKELLPKLDLILWVIKGDERAFSSDEYFYNHVLVPAGGENNVLFVLNQIDKIEPFREWDITNNCPSSTQLVNIKKKEVYLSERLGFIKNPVVSVSANEGYNIIKLVEAMIRALPDCAKSGATAQLKDEYKTDSVKDNARDGFAEIISEAIDEVIDILPVRDGVKNLMKNGKDIVVEKLKKIWGYFFE